MRAGTVAYFGRARRGTVVEKQVAFDSRRKAVRPARGSGGDQAVASALERADGIRIYCFWGSGCVLHVAELHRWSGQRQSARADRGRRLRSPALLLRRDVPSARQKDRKILTRPTMEPARCGIRAVGCMWFDRGERPGYTGVSVFPQTQHSLSRDRPPSPYTGFRMSLWHSIIIKRRTHER